MGLADFSDDYDDDTEGGGLSALEFPGVGARASILSSDPESTYGIPTGALAQLSPSAIADDAVERLGERNSRLPPDPMLDEFLQMSKNFMLTGDDDFKQAQLRGAEARKRLGSLDEIYAKGSNLPLMKMAAGLLAPSKTGRFSENLGMGIDAFANTEGARQHQGIELGLEQAKLAQLEADRAENRQQQRMTVGTKLAMAVAAMKRADNMAARIGQQSDHPLVKAAIASGLMQGTPEFQDFIQKHLYLQQVKGAQNQAAAKVIIGSPKIKFGTPEFVAAVNAEQERIEKFEMEKSANINARTQLTQTEVPKVQAQTAQTQQQTRQGRVPELGDDANPKYRGYAGGGAVVGDDPRDYLHAQEPEDYTNAPGMIPPPEKNPYNFVETSARDKMYVVEQNMFKSMHEAEQKSMNDRADIMSGISQVKDDLLKGRLYTGGLTGVYYNALGAFPGAGGLITDPAAANMLKVQNYITQRMRPPGSGSVSNYEDRMFKGAGLSFGSPMKSNLDFIDRMESVYKLQQRRTEAIEQYFNNNRTMQGFESYWDHYMKDNYQGEKGDYKINLNPPPFRVWAAKTFKQ